jgi:hypothetical protein
MYWVALAEAAEAGGTDQAHSDRTDRHGSRGRPGATSTSFTTDVLSNKVPHGIADFTAINLDTVFFSVLPLFGAFCIAARRATTTPGKFRCCEVLVNLSTTRSGTPSTAPASVPLALTIFPDLLFNIGPGAVDLLPAAAPTPVSTPRWCEHRPTPPSRYH